VLGVRRLDLMVATHPHADHIAGLPAVLAWLPVASLLEPGCREESPGRDELLAAAQAEGVPIGTPRSGEVLRIGDVRLEVLAPSSCWSGTDSDTNNDSLVLLASVGQDTVLLTGDVEIPAQEALVEAGVSLEADVLKVPHHGGATLIPAFFDAVDPGIAVVSTGQPNPYGHPTPEALGWLRATGARIVRTDLVGDVVVTFVGGRPVVASAA
jgi:competence protein ComEC